MNNEASLFSPIRRQACIKDGQPQWRIHVYASSDHNLETKYMHAPLGSVPPTWELKL